jgi:hypothetical protein
MYRIGKPLLAQSTETGVSLDRLRRRVMFERIIARFQATEPGQWVLKGGMALEVRLRDGARLTKDVVLGLRDDTLAIDLDHDYFIFTVGPPERLRDASGGFPTWRAKVGAQLADSNMACSYRSKRQPQSDPYSWNATTPNRRTTSRSCQSRGQTATCDLLPATA